MLQNIATSGNPGIEEALGMNRGISSGIDALIGKDAYKFSGYDYKAPDMYADTGKAYQFTRPDEYKNTSTAFNFTGANFADPGEFTGENVTKYMSPYMQNVVDIEKRKAAQEYGLENQKRAANSVFSGAFGGSRSGVQQAMAENDYLNRAGDIQSKGLQSAWDSARDIFSSDRTARYNTDVAKAADLRARERAQADEYNNQRDFGYGVFADKNKFLSDYEKSQAGEDFQNREFGYDVFKDNRTAATDYQDKLAEQNQWLQESQSSEDRLKNTFDLGALDQKSGVAGNIADLSTAAKNGDIKAAQILEAIGRDQKDESQAGLDVAYQDWLRQQENPRQQLSDYAAILRGLPLSGIGTTTATGSSTSTPAQPSGIQQILGLGTTALGLGKGLI